VTYCRTQHPWRSRSCGSFSGATGPVGNSFGATGPVGISWCNRSLRGFVAQQALLAVTSSLWTAADSLPDSRSCVCQSLLEGSSKAWSIALLGVEVRVGAKLCDLQSMFAGATSMVCVVLQFWEPPCFESSSSAQELCWAIAGPGGLRDAAAAAVLPCAAQHHACGRCGPSGSDLRSTGCCQNIAMAMRGLRSCWAWMIMGCCSCAAVLQQPV
jgi:hypothetical protein